MDRALRLVARINDMPIEDIRFRIEWAQGATPLDIQGRQEAELRARAIVAAERIRGNR